MATDHSVSSPAASKREREESPLFVSEESSQLVEQASAHKRPKVADRATDAIARHELVSLDEDSARKYSATDGRPRLATYHPLYSEAEADLTNLCTEYTTLLRELLKAGYSNEDVENIVQQLGHYQDPRKRYPEIKASAMVGPMGAGKSRIINCILNQQGAAIDSDSADRGTNIVHEYLGPELGQTEEIRVKAIYYSSTQLKNRVKKRCQDILTFLEKAGSKDAGEELDDDDLSDLEEKHDNGVQYFHGMLCDQSSFETEEEATDFFREQYEDGLDLDNLTEAMMKYIEIFLASRNIADGIETHVAKDCDELLGIFDKVSKPLLHAEDNKTPHPWPIIRVVRIHMDHDMLKAGVILADTPGVTDKDQSVVDSTTTYLRHAGNIFIVTQRLRTAKHGDIDAVLRLCLHLGKANNTYLVMTKIDQKDPLKPHERKKLPPDVREALEGAEKRKTDLELELKTLPQKMDDLWSRGIDRPEVQSEHHAAQKRYRSLPKLIKDAEADAFQIAVEVGNRHSEAEMRDKFRKISKSKTQPDLKVIFVSASEYQMNVSKPESAKLKPEATGVPSLQRLLYSGPTVGKLRTLRRIAAVNLPGVFQGVIGALTKDRLERKADVLKIIDLVLSDRDGLADSLFGTMDDLFEEKIEMLFLRHEKAWCEKLEKKFSDWKKYHTATFSAFCRRRGRWNVPKSGQKKEKKKVSWVADIQDVAAKEVGSAFDELIEGVKQLQSDGEDNIRDWFTKLETQLRVCAAYQGVANTKKGEEFLKALRTKRDEVARFTNIMFDSFIRQLSMINAKVTVDTWEKDSPVSYVGLLMEEACDTAKDIKSPPGTKITKAQRKANQYPHFERVEVLREVLFGTSNSEMVDEPKPNVFQAVYDSAQQAYEDMRDPFKAKLGNKLNETSKEIKKDFGRRYVVKEEVQQDPQATQALLDGGREMLGYLSIVERKLDICEEWEKSGSVASV